MHSTTEGLGLQTRLRWVKPGSWAQQSHSLCLEEWNALVVVVVYRWVFKVVNIAVLWCATITHFNDQIAVYWGWSEQLSHLGGLSLMCTCVERNWYVGGSYLVVHNDKLNRRSLHHIVTPFCYNCLIVCRTHLHILIPHITHHDSDWYTASYVTPIIHVWCLGGTCADHTCITPVCIPVYTGGCLHICHSIKEILLD